MCSRPFGRQAQKNAARRHARSRPPISDPQAGREPEQRHRGHCPRRSLSGRRPLVGRYRAREVPRARPTGYRSASCWGRANQRAELTDGGIRPFFRLLTCQTRDSADAASARVDPHSTHSADSPKTIVTGAHVSASANPRLNTSRSERLHGAVLSCLPAR